MTKEKKNNVNGYDKTGWIRSLIDGSFLSREIVFKHFRFILFLMFLGLLYIWNRNHAEKLVRETIKLKREVEELKSEQLSVTSTLMRLSQQSEVESLIVKQNLDLINSETPPFKLTVQCPKREKKY